VWRGVHDIHHVHASNIVRRYVQTRFTANNKLAYASQLNSFTHLRARMVLQVRFTFRFIDFAFVSLVLLSVHWVCFRFIGSAFVSLAMTFVSLVLLSFHWVCFRFNGFAFVLWGLLSFHWVRFRFTSTTCCSDVSQILTEDFHLCVRLPTLSIMALELFLGGRILNRLNILLILIEWS
jgi:hypothetical protein